MLSCVWKTLLFTNASRQCTVWTFRQMGARVIHRIALMSDNSGRPMFQEGLDNLDARSFCQPQSLQCITRQAKRFECQSGLSRWPHDVSIRNALQLQDNPCGTNTECSHLQVETSRATEQHSALACARLGPEDRLRPSELTQKPNSLGCSMSSPQHDAPGLSTNRLQAQMPPIFPPALPVVGSSHSLARPGADIDACTKEGKPVTVPRQSHQTHASKCQMQYEGLFQSKAPPVAGGLASLGTWIPGLLQQQLSLYSAKAQLPGRVVGQFPAGQQISHAFQQQTGFSRQSSALSNMPSTPQTSEASSQGRQKRLKLAEASSW